MTHAMAAVCPTWVSDELFPFESKFFATSSGHAMQFIAEEATEQILPVLNSLINADVAHRSLSKNPRADRAAAPVVQYA